MTITRKRAAEIAAELNRARGSTLGGGKFVYAHDGSGGEWYADNSYRLGDVVILYIGPKYDADDVWAIFNDDPGGMDEDELQRRFDKSQDRPERPATYNGLPTGT